jgi:carboxypeptidase Taq
MNLYEKYTYHLKRVADISYAAAVLNWDQETYMPENGAEQRASQLSTLSGIAHELFTSNEFGNVLKQLIVDTSLDEIQRRNVIQTKRAYDRSTKLSKEHVEELALAISQAFQAWQTAKTSNHFDVFVPHLKRLVDLKRKECEWIGYDEHPYDAMLDEYEPGLTVKQLDQLFEDVRRDLVPYVQQLTNRTVPEIKWMNNNYPKDAQWQLSIDILHKIGFDFNSGRQDISMHPFTINFGAQDVRVTTKIDENDLADCLTGTIHEGGHALYEQGLKPDAYGTPEGEATSLGIHESQSRLWENQVGRSEAFWKALLPDVLKRLGEHANGITPEDFARELNIVQPSLIRISADELTYHFHIMVRYEIEKQLFEGKLDVADIPAKWNTAYKSYLNIDVPDDARGCLQDVHWSHGSFGYFPTYSIGSFYAAQFYHRAQQQIPDLEEQIVNGNFTPLLKWLRENIHQHGKLYSADELCQRITGESLSFSYFMNYAKHKYDQLYRQ